MLHWKQEKTKVLTSVHFHTTRRALWHVVIVQKKNLGCSICSFNLTHEWHLYFMKNMYVFACSCGSRMLVCTQNHGASTPDSLSCNYVTYVSIKLFVSQSQRFLFFHNACIAATVRRMWNDVTAKINVCVIFHVLYHDCGDAAPERAAKRISTPTFFGNEP